MIPVKSSMAIVLALCCTLQLRSQCNVVINEVNPNPPPGINPNPGTANSMTNSFYDQGEINGPDDDQEWVELYNPNPCQAIDISCWILGSDMTDITLPTPQYTQDNWFYFTFPTGTTIPPLGHLVIGGHATPNVDFSTKTYISTPWFCSFARSLLRDSNGWVALYDQNGNPIDAVYWGMSGNAAEINTVPLYSNNINVSAGCTCGSSNKTLPSVRNIPNNIKEFGGRVFTGTDLTLARVPDGGAWASSNAATPGNCNGGTCYVPATVTVPNKTACPGQTKNLKATVNTGGSSTGPYSSLTYKWSDPAGQATQTATGLTSGNYTVEVTDACGCKWSGSGSISSVDLAATTSVTLDEGCDRFGGVTGSVTVTVTSGTGPFTYQWDDPQNQTTQTAVGLTAGTYTVTVNSQQGCSTTSSATIEDKIILSHTINTEPTCQSCSDGEVTVNVSGTGEPPFTYRWSDAGEQTTQTATGLPPGTYTVTVTDSEGCFTTQDVILNFSTGINDLLSIESFATVFPNPNNGDFRIQLNKPFTEESQVSLFDISGKLVYSNPLVSQITEIKSDLSPGLYHLMLTSQTSKAVGRISITE